jgi:hypothetical protein
MRSLLVVAGLAIAAAPAAAEPYLALRTGLKCSACHTNLTGGGNRTTFGAIFAQTQLPLKPGTVVSKSVAEFLQIGWDLRVAGSGTFKASTPRTSIDLEEAQLYAAAELLQSRLVLYIDQTVGPERAVAREAFGMVKHLPGESYVKAGKFLLPYGLRLPDNAEYIRERTGFTYYTPDQGVEVGMEPGPLAFQVALTNGNAGAAENDNGKEVTSSASVTFRRFRLGASASMNDGASNRRQVFGGFGGFSLGPLVMLGELDHVRDQPVSGDTVKQLMAFAEADWLLLRGLNAKVTYGWLDPNTAIAENEKVRARFGLELFPTPFLRFAGFYTLLQDIPQATTDLDRWSVEAHVLF